MIEQVNGSSGEPLSLDCWLILFDLKLPYIVKNLMHINVPTFTEDGKEPGNSEAPERNPQYTTVYVGNLGPEVGSHFIS